MCCSWDSGGGVVVVGPALALPLVGHRSWCPTRHPGMPSPGSELGVDAHLTSGAGDDLHRGVDVVGVEVGHLGLGDLADLVLGEPAGLGLVRLAGALLDTR